ncbi:MAG: hypothetical protein LBB58_00190, partial [Cellulomonadaceae bacterium]|nr:hypothetical protein [Cellulomonadaceae bacterium]
NDTILVLRELDLDISIFGVFSAFGAAGGLLGTWVSIRLSKKYPSEIIIPITTSLLVFVAFLPLLAALSAPNIAVIFLAASSFFWAIIMTVGNIQFAALEARRIPTKVLGRVTSISSMLTYGLPVPIGSIVGGLVGDFAGTRTAIVTTVALIAIAAVISIIGVQRRSGSLVAG